jgi:hypothetical protein
MFYTDTSSGIGVGHGQTSQKTDFTEDRLRSMLGKFSRPDDRLRGKTLATIVCVVIALNLDWHGLIVRVLCKLDL